jgi:thiosulfate/3-mercaptopyruvate sulfurtransferase
MSQRFANEQLLVGTEWLAQHLDEPELRLVEVSTPGAGYTLGHIRNAVYFNLSEAFSGGRNGLAHLLAPVQEVADTLGRKGIVPDKRVVICDENGGARAAQMFWLLEYLGFPRVSVLEGGVERWLAEGRPQTRKIPEIAPVRFTPQVRDELYADVNWVTSHLDSETVALIDCRSEEEYRQGHIPGARHRNWEQSLRLKAYQAFRASDELNAEVGALGAREEKDVVTYCGTGQRSSHTYLTLRLLGYPRVRNYIGSWTEWSSRDDLPRE